MIIINIYIQYINITIGQGMPRRVDELTCHGRRWRQNRPVTFIRAPPPQATMRLFLVAPMLKPHSINLERKSQLLDSSPPGSTNLSAARPRKPLARCLWTGGTVPWTRKLSPLPPEPPDCRRFSPCSTPSQS